MYQQEFIRPAYEQPVIIAEKPRSIGLMVVSAIFFIIVVIVIICLVSFFSGSSTASSVSSSAANNIRDNANNFPTAKPQMRTLGLTSSNNTPGYITVKADSYNANILGENKTSSLGDCIDLCNNNKDCEGVKYKEELCSTLSNVPEVKYKGSSNAEELYLKDDSRPIIVDRVFVASQKYKLISKEWWNLTTGSGDNNVFTTEDTKIWYLPDTKFDVINYGRLHGIYSNKKLTDIQVKDLLDKDIHPAGIDCIVDVPYSDNYSLDLSKFVRKPIYVVYV